MDAQQLSDMLQSAVVADFPDWQPGQTEQWPKQYFSYGVMVIAPNGQQTPRAPKYCATNLGAAYLSNVLTSQANMPNTILLADAITGETAGWSDTEPVPWLQFWQKNDPPAGPFSGKKLCAGLLLDYFNHGLSGDKALAECVEDILES